MRERHVRESLALHILAFKQRTTRTLSYNRGKWADNMTRSTSYRIADSWPACQKHFPGHFSWIRYLWRRGNYALLPIWEIDGHFEIVMLLRQCRGANFGLVMISQVLQLLRIQTIKCLARKWFEILAELIIRGMEMSFVRYFLDCSIIK